MIYKQHPKIEKRLLEYKRIKDVKFILLILNLQIVKKQRTN